jgi:hypothetical protein
MGHYGGNNHSTDHVRRRRHPVVACIARESTKTVPSALRSEFDLSGNFALLAYACGHGSLDSSGSWQSRSYALVGTLKRDFAHPCRRISRRPAKAACRCVPSRKPETVDTTRSYRFMSL